MCGFAGELRRRRSVDLAALGRMAVALRRRGPDGEGVWSDGRVGFAHQRLTVIDLTERGSQPMVDPDLGAAIVFNGCVYNHAELRRELEGEGYEFFSHSDTEVILKAVDHWGRDAVKRFRGMFAFALWDIDTGRLLLARDRLGIKPLYYTDDPDRLRFASTLPALLAGGGVDTAIDPVALHHYLSWHGVVPAPHTLLRGVRKLTPATTVMVEPDGTFDEQRYWHVDFDRRPDASDWDADAWSDAVLDALRESVRWRMVSDVGVGVLLSGGLDSSLIVALLADLGHEDIATFSIGFSDVGDREGNEFRYSDLVARHFGTHHERFTISDAEVAETVVDAIASMSEPMPSHDAVAFYLLSKDVVPERKVVQSGQGADEIFAGYSWYPPVAQAQDDGLDTYRAEFFDRSADRLADLIEPEHRLERDVSSEFVARHFAHAGASVPIDRALRLDTEVMLVDDPVKRLDNMSMAWGLEVRTPFLDHQLVELAAACPPELKLADGGKGVLKAAGRRLLPVEVVDRPKGYFPVPALSELTGPTLDLARDALTSPAARDRGLFRNDVVDELLADPNGHRTNLDGSTLWQLAVVELWLQRLGV